MESPRPPNVPARMTFLALLCAGSVWGIHALGLRWLWSAPLGIVAGMALYIVWLVIDGRHRPGCLPDEGLPRPVRRARED